MSDKRTKIIIETDAGRSEQVLRSVERGLKGVGNEAQKAGQGVKSGTGAMDAAFAKTALSAAALGVAVKSAFSMAKEAANLSEARLYLQTLAAEMGVSYEKLDQVTKKATNGLVDNLTLIKNNHKALKLGVTTDVNELGRLWQIADSLGDEFGQGIEQTFEQITKAISEGNAKSLISLGLLPESFKRASDSASLLERRTQLLNEVFKQAGPAADNLAAQGDTSADKFARFDVAVKNLKNSLGEALIPLFTPIIEGFTAIANAASSVIDKFTQLSDLNSKSPLLGKSLEELKKLRETTAARATSLGFEVEALSRPASQGGKAGQYTEGQRQQLSIQLAGEKQMLKEIDRVIADLEQRTKARAEAQSRVVAGTQEETKEKEKLVGTQKEYNRAQEIAAKQLEDLLAVQVKSFGKAITDGREAVQMFNAMTAAAAGFAVGLKDGTTEAGKLYGEISKLQQRTEEFTQNFTSMLTNRGYNAADDLRKLNPDAAMMGMMNYMSGGLFTAQGSTKDALKDIKEPLSKTIAEAVQQGFANADFSDLGRTLGEILSSVISRSVAQSNPIMNAAGGINFGNLATNIGVSLAVSALTKPGRFFGGREEKYKSESIAAAQSLREQMGAAYLKSHETSMLPYLQSGHKQDLSAGRMGYFGTMTGYQWSDSGNGIWSNKTRTYSTIDHGASAALKTLTEAMQRAERYNREVERSYELMTAQGYDYKALTEQAAVYARAANSAYGGVVGLSWSDGGKDERDISEAAHEIKMAAIELGRQLGQATADRSTATAEGFAKYAPWLSSIQLPEGIGSGLRVSLRDILQIPGSAKMDTLSTSQQYDAFSSLQTNFMDRKISPYLLDMVKQAGGARYELESLKMSSPDDYAQKYLEYVEKQVEAFNEVMKRQERIFMDASKTFEERSQALQVFENSQEAYYQAKLDMLSSEKAAEEAVKRQQQEADLRRMETMESALSLTGEIAQRGDKIIILQGGDSPKAIRELMGRYGDDPEMISILQSLLKIADDKARWG